MKMIAPNIARPIRNPSVLATRKTDDRNSPSGMIGSAVRPSCQMNSAIRTTPATARPTITGDPQSYWFPPHVVTRISELTPAVSSTAPR